MVKIGEYVLEAGEADRFHQMVVTAGLDQVHRRMGLWRLAFIVEATFAILIGLALWWQAHTTRGELRRVLLLENVRCNGVREGLENARQYGSERRTDLALDEFRRAERDVVQCSTDKPAAKEALHHMDIDTLIRLVPERGADDEDLAQ